MKEIDLDPLEYRQIDGPKRKEPILAHGWYWGMLALASVIGVKLAIMLAVRS
jgi:hypothetical protein